MLELIGQLSPICTSLTGNGVRQVLSLLRQRVEMQQHEVPSGTRVLDWTVPKEWNIKDAYVANSQGERVIDLQKNPLHIMGYSVPFRGKLALSELKKHLFSDPENPDWIPFRYSYYTEDWGFCLAHRELEQLDDGEYDVVIDSTLENGHLTYGECYFPGASTDELLVSVHVDHPYMCNDNLSGVAVTTFLAEQVANIPNRQLSYRFIFIPTTIGSITWLSRNESSLDRLKYGFVVTCIGDSAGFTWKKTRRGDTKIDRIVECALRESGEAFRVRDFDPVGYDERQFCSPGFNLPVGCLFRTYSSDYPENHSSADNIDLISAEKLEGALALCTNIVQILEGDRSYLNTSPKGEPQLGTRGDFYRKTGGQALPGNHRHMLWVLNYSDGEHSLVDIAEKSGFAFSDIRAAADLLGEYGLLVPVEQSLPPQEAQHCPR